MANSVCSEIFRAKIYSVNMVEAAENAIVLFDGVCNFCNGSVNFIIARDPEGYFKFAPLQSKIGEKLLAEYKINKNLTDSVILIENNRAYTHSTAVVQIARKLSGASRWLYGFVVVPKFVRDFFYKLFARNRYKIFGKKDSCPTPTPEIRRRFLS